MAVDMDVSLYPCTAFAGMTEFSVGTVKAGIDEPKLRAFLDTKIDSDEVCSKCWAKREYVKVAPPVRYENITN